MSKKKGLTDYFNRISLCLDNRLEGYVHTRSYVSNCKLVVCLFKLARKGSYFAVVQNIFDKRNGDKRRKKVRRASAWKKIQYVFKKKKNRVIILITYNVI